MAKKGICNTFEEVHVFWNVKDIASFLHVASMKIKSLLENKGQYFSS